MKTWAASLFLLSLRDAGDAFTFRLQPEPWFLLAVEITVRRSGRHIWVYFATLKLLNSEPAL